MVLLSLSELKKNKGMIQFVYVWTVSKTRQATQKQVDKTGL